MPGEGGRTEKLRGTELSLIFHFFAIVYIKAHVIVLEPLFNAILNLLQCRVLAEHQLAHVGIIEHVHGGEAGRQNIHHSDGYQPTGQPVQLMKGTVANAVESR